MNIRTAVIPSICFGVFGGVMDNSIGGGLLIYFASYIAFYITLRDKN
jgi:outer membrane lipoprotein SlyB